jgi:DNA-binding CsgD family transcriptional regulator
MKGQAMSLELDATTAQLLVHLAEVWRVTEEEAIRRAVERTTAAIASSIKGIYLTEREASMLRLLAQGFSSKEIARELDQSVSRTVGELKAAQKKILQCIRTPGETTTSSRLQTFKELQNSLQLTSAKAREWQDAIHEARR